MADNAAEKCKKCSRDIAEASECERCDVKYCSRSCQNLHWKTHKKSCARTRDTREANPPPPPPHFKNFGGSSASNQSTAWGPSQPTPRRGLAAPITAAFTRLDRGTYLHDRPEQDVYKVLVDTYRLRMEDNHKIDGVVEPDSIYASGANNDGMAGFRRFLAAAAGTRPKVLPPWWDEEKQRECEALAAAAGWSSLRTRLSKADVIQHYGDDHFPMQLRMLGEAVWGTAPGGADGTAMRRMLASRETGAFPGPGVASILHMDSTTGNAYSSGF